MQFFKYKCIVDNSLTDEVVYSEEYGIVCARDFAAAVSEIEDYYRDSIFTIGGIVPLCDWEFSDGSNILDFEQMGGLSEFFAFDVCKGSIIPKMPRRVELTDKDCSQLFLDT